MHPIRFKIRVPGTFLCSGRRAYLFVLLSLAFPLYARNNRTSAYCSSMPARIRTRQTSRPWEKHLSQRFRGYPSRRRPPYRRTRIRKVVARDSHPEREYLYYCGEVDTVKSNDGKRSHYAMQIGGHERLPPTTRPTGRERPEEHPLSTARLSQVLSDNTARDQLVLIDCLGIADTINTGSDQATLMKSAQGSTKGHFHAVFYPGSSVSSQSQR